MKNDLNKGTVVRLRRDICADSICLNGRVLPRSYKNGELGVIVERDMALDGEAIINVLFQSDMEDLGKLLHKGTGWVPADNYIRLVGIGTPIIEDYEFQPIHFSDLEVVIDMGIVNPPIEVRR